MGSKITFSLWSRYRNKELISRLLKFSLVGGSGVLVNTGALFLLYEIGHLTLLFASVLAVELSIMSNFLWNNRWTFGQNDISPGRFLRFNLISIGGLGITTGTLYMATSHGIYYLLGNLLGIGIATIWNFALNVLWTWRWEG